MKTKEAVLKEVKSMLLGTERINRGGGILYVYYSKSEIGVAEGDDVGLGWHLKIRYYATSFAALNAYAETPCSWSHVALGDDVHELSNSLRILNDMILQNYEELFADQFETQQEVKLGVIEPFDVDNLAAVGNTIYLAEEYKLTTEVIASAMHYYRSCPEFTMQDALTAGLNEWVK